MINQIKNISIFRKKHTDQKDQKEILEIVEKVKIKYQDFVPIFLLRDNEKSPVLIKEGFFLLKKNST